MSIREDIENQYIQSVKNKNVKKTNALRLIKSSIKNKDIAARSTGVKEGVSHQEIIGLLRTLVKQRKDSIESFQIANRQDLVENEQSEIEIITSFLPKQKNEQETENIINHLIQKNSLNSLKDMGELMSFLKADYYDQIDMGLAGKIAKSKLSD